MTTMTMMLTTTMTKTLIMTTSMMTMMMMTTAKVKMIDKERIVSSRSTPPLPNNHTSGIKFKTKVFPSKSI